MGAHIDKDGQFQSDKYPTCPAGKVPLSVKDVMAQDLLWTYAVRRREVDAEFSDDLEAALRTAGYDKSKIDFSLKRGDIVTAEHWIDAKGKPKQVEVIDVNWVLRAAAVNLRPRVGTFANLTVWPVYGMKKVETTS